MSDIRNTALNSVHIDNIIVEKIKIEGSMALTLNQKKIILYLVSLIQQTDSKLEEVTISFADFFRLINVSYSSRNRQELEKSVLNLASKCFLLPLNDGQYKVVCKWVDKAAIDYDKKELHFKLDDSLKPYILGLAKKARTIFKLGYILRFKQKYAIDIFLFASRCKNMNQPYLLPIERAYQLFGSCRYKNYTDLNRFVLKKAILEINEKSDLKIIVDPIRNERNKTTHIAFTVFKKTGDALENARSWETELHSNKTINEQVREAFQDNILDEALDIGYIKYGDPDDFSNFDSDDFLEKTKKYCSKNIYDELVKIKKQKSAES